jgi:hypothetical protein
MPLFDGAIHFLGCDRQLNRGSFTSMNTTAARHDRSPHAIDKYCDLKPVWAAYK